MAEVSIIVDITKKKVDVNVDDFFFGADVGGRAARNFSPADAISGE